MTEEELNAIVIEQLGGFGVRLAPIPRVEGELTADLPGEDEEHHFYIEAKCRDRTEARESVVADLGVGGSVSLVPEPIDYRNAMSSSVEEGVRQLERSAGDRVESVRFLWLHCSDDDPTTDRFQLEGTLCGNMHFVDRLRPEEGSLSCYFFTESAFFTHGQTLDGAFICDDEGWFLLLNPHSPRFQSLRRSALSRALGGACWDPISMEAEGRLLIADCSIPRRQSEAVLDYVNTKYSRDLVQTEVRRFEMITRIN
jgi:hypothetical protein